jgi:quercetin dioxygenase-like cupin family protein
MSPYLHIPNLLDAVTTIAPDSIISRTIYQDERLKAIVFGFAPGQELSEHTAARPAILHILAGEADVTVGGDAWPASAGDWTHMQPHLPHSIRAKTQVIMLLLML